MNKESLVVAKTVLETERANRKEELKQSEITEFFQKKNTSMYKSYGNFENYLEKKYGIQAKGQNDCKKEGSMSRRIRSYS